MSQSVQLNFLVPTNLSSEVIWAVHTVLWKDRRAKLEELTKRLHDLDIIVNDQTFERCFRGAPIVRASTYAKVTRHQEDVVYGGGYERRPGRLSHHPRRPVAMRAAGLTLKNYGIPETHTGIGNWLDRVVERYLRRIRFTCVDRDVIRGDIESIATRADRIGYRLGFAARKSLVDRWEFNRDIWIDGEPIAKWDSVTTEHLKVLKELNAVKQKVDKVIDKATA